MKKYLTVLSILIVVAICAICMTIFAACDNDNELATDKIYITVLDENGNAIDGTTFGEADFDPSNHQVIIQFCTLDGGCTSQNPNVGKDGKAEFDLSIVKGLAEANSTDTVELHVQGVAKVGYKIEYGQYKVSEIPKNITVTLKKA